MASGGFRKEIRLLDGIMLVAGIMIGSGIFLVSADIARTVGSSGYLLVVWALAGVLTLIAALSFGELTSMYPHAGGQYVFLREQYNPMFAFLYGWTLFLVIQTGTIAAVAVAFAKFCAVFVPYFNAGNALADLGFVDINTQKLLAIAVILVLTAINAGGVRYGKFIQTFFGSAKIMALFGLIGIGLFVSNADAIAQNFGEMWKAHRVVQDGTAIERIPLVGWSLIAAIGVAMIGSLFSMDAWNNITFAGDEVVNPKKTIPRSMAIGVTLVAVIYLAMNVVYLANLPLVGEPRNGTRNVFLQGIQFAADDRVGVAAADAMAGHHAVLLVAALIIVSTFSCLNGLILTGARVYYQMAADKVFFPGMGRLNNKGVPAVALVFQAVWAAVICLSGKYNDILNYVIMATLIFYILTIYGIFILRRKLPHAPRPVKAFGYPYLQWVYIVLASLICVILPIYKPDYSWPGIIIVLIGIPVYYWFKRRISHS